MRKSRIKPKDLKPEKRLRNSVMFAVPGINAYDYAPSVNLSDEEDYYFGVENY